MDKNVLLSSLDTPTDQEMEDTLKHFGVPGMRWGVRRSRSSSSSSSSKKSKGSKTSDDYKESRRLKKMKSKKLSNKELQDLNKRLNLERQYKDLTPGTIRKGMAFAAGVAGAGTTLATIYAFKNTPLVKDVARAIASK